MSPAEIDAYRALDNAYETADTPQAREIAACGMLRARLSSGLSHFEILRRSAAQIGRRADLTALGFTFQRPGAP